MIRSLLLCRLLRFPTELTTTSPQCKLLSQKYIENKISDYHSSSAAGLSHTITISARHSSSFNSSRVREVVATSTCLKNQVRSNCSESKTSAIALNFNRFSQIFGGKTFVRAFTSTKNLKSSTQEKKIVKKRMVSSVVRIHAGNLLCECMT